MDKKTAKDTVFSAKSQIKFISDSPSVMGVVNVTDDSFYKGSRIYNSSDLIRKVEQMVQEGVSIIDIGGCSTRPGAKLIDQDIEEKRVIPAIEIIAKHFPSIAISADTFRSQIASKAVAEGASMVNDVSAGEMDKEMFQTVAKLDVPYVLMHMKGMPNSMQKNPEYKDVFSEVYTFFETKLKAMKVVGLEKIILDPGFGFGKSLNHNFELLNRLGDFLKLDMPILVGLSRKSMIGRVLEVKPEHSLNGTSVLNTIALLNGASILRVHDVKEAIETIKLLNAYRSANLSN